MSIDAAAGPRLVWAHRWLGTGLLLRITSAAGGQLVATRNGATPETIELAALSSGRNDVTVDLPAALAATADPIGDWSLAVQPGDETPVTMTAAPRATQSLGPMTASVGPHTATIQVVTGSGQPVEIRVEGRDPWGEVAEVARDGASVRITGRVVGRASTPHSAVLAERDGPGRIVTDLQLDGDGYGFTVTVDLTTIPTAGGVSHWNVVLVTDEGELRVARHLDDVVDKGRAVVPRPSLLQDGDGWWIVTPRFTDHNNVVITTTERRTGAGPPDPRERWELDPGDLLEAGDDGLSSHRWTGPVARLVRRVAAGVFGRLETGRTHRPTDAAVDTDGRRPIHLLIASVHATGGTIRATINTANALAADDRNHVTLGVVYRLKKRQFFDISPAVRVQVMVNEPWIRTRPRSDPRGWLRNLAMSLPSALVPREDPRYYRFSLWHDVQLFRWLRSIRSGTIVTTRSGLSCVAARFARPGVRIVAQQHVPFGSQPEALRDELLSSYRSIDAVAVLTGAEQEELGRLLAGSGTEVVRIPNALYDLDPPRSPLEERRIVCGGRFTPVKGIDLLIEAFARIAAQRPDWELRVYGPARRDRLEAVREMVRQHGLEERVLLMPASSRLEVEMSKASVCAVPSRFEAFGMMIIEAMRCGLPVVSFDCPTGPREIITDGVDGLLVPPEDPAAFADALLKVTGDGQLRARLADEGLRTTDRFSPETQAAEWSTLLDRLAR